MRNTKIKTIPKRKWQQHEATSNKWIRTEQILLRLLISSLELYFRMYPNWDHNLYVDHIRTHLKGVHNISGILPT